MNELDNILGGKFLVDSAVYRIVNVVDAHDTNADVVTNIIAVGDDGEVIAVAFENFRDGIVRVFGDRAAADRVCATSDQDDDAEAA